MKKYLISTIIAVIVLLLGLKGCPSELGEMVRSVLPQNDRTVKRDTVVVYLSDTLLISDTVWLSKTFTKTVRPSPDTVYLAVDRPENKYASGTVYRDSVYFYSGSVSDTVGTVSYKAETLGRIDNISLSYKLKAPFRVVDMFAIKNEKTERITNTVSRSGLFLGMGATYIPDKAPSPTINLSLTLPRGWNMGYHFTPVYGYHSINAQVRIF